MSSIFNRIFRYRQSKHRTSSEDYFTETFVAVLDRCKPLRIAFVEWLIGSKNIKQENIESVCIETQKSFIDGSTGPKSDIEKFLKDKWMSGRWGFGYTEGWQYSPTIKDY